MNLSYRTLKKGEGGQSKKISFFKIFNYILKLMYIGFHWKQIPVEKDESGEPEIHHTKIFNSLKFWPERWLFRQDI